MKKWFIINTFDKTQTEIVFDESTNLKMGSEGGKLQSRSPGYSSLEELKKDRNIPDYNCTICNGVIDAGYNNKKELFTHKMCFTCNHFRAVEKAANKNPNRVIINGGSYHISPNVSHGFKGFGGRLFKIKRFDSKEVIECKNLWHQGTIPKEWKERIPNNAEFIK